VNWQRLQTLVAMPPLELKLEPGRTVRGRVVDAAGNPAAGLSLRFAGFHRVPEPLPVEIDEISAPAWPAPIVTGADGQFVLNGLPRGCTTYLRVDDERYGPQWLSLAPDEKAETDAGTLTLPAPRVVEGTVVAEDTKQPLAGAIVVIASHGAGNPGIQGRVMVTADENGRFTARPYPGQSLTVTAAGAAGTPYLAASKSIQWPAGARQPEIKLRVPRGVLVRGQVIEQGTGRAVVGARVHYRPVSAMNAGSNGNLLVLLNWLDVASDANGRFEIVALPGPGNLLVRSPDGDFVSLEVSEEELIYGTKGAGKKISNRLYFPDTLVPLDLKANEKPDEVVAKLRRGVTIAGRVETFEGKPVANGFLVSRNYLGAGWEKNSEFLPIRDGLFEIPGCDPGLSEPFWFWDHKNLLGAMVRLSAKEQGTVVRLAPFGSASVRVVDPNGTAVPIKEALIQLVVRPGRGPADETDRQTPPRLTLDARFQGLQVVPAAGTVTAKALVPGATYILELGPGLSTRPFSVTAGQALSLPDLVTNAPPKSK
jgi:hypothetical protein